MKIYRYGKETGAFVGKFEANVDPKRTDDDIKRHTAEVNIIRGMDLAESEKKSLEDKLLQPVEFYLIPANATEKKPPTVNEGEIQVFENGEWAIKKNLVGTVYHFDDQEESFQMMVLGDLPEGAIEGEKPLSDNQKWLNIRNKRDMLLSSTDWTQVVDSPLATARQLEFADYRQTLRDIPQDQTDPDNIIWPEMV